MPFPGKQRRKYKEAYKRAPGTSRTHSAAHAEDTVTSQSSQAPLHAIADNRPQAAQLLSQQNTIQLANRNSRRRKFARDRRQEESAARESSDLRVANFGDNWEVLEISDYMKRHNLQMQRMTRVIGKSVMHLSDGSIILIDSNQYWRHESAGRQDEYYDSAHAINGDNAKTHFWTRKGYANYKLDLSA